MAALGEILMRNISSISNYTHRRLALSIPNVLSCCV